jgi:pimeloyl-ACP methyl ester carboxylesterase
VQDLRAVLNHFGIQKAVLLGWSMGVQVSLEAWRQTPAVVQGLVLINGPYGSPLKTAFSPMLQGSPLAGMLPAIGQASESLAHLAEPIQPLAQKVTKTKRAPNLNTGWAWRARRWTGRSS